MKTFARTMALAVSLFAAGCASQTPMPHDNQRCAEMQQTQHQSGGMGMMGMMDHEQMMKMHEHMQKMREDMAKIRQEKDPARREQMMQQHMDEMDKNMGMMQDMMGHDSKNMPADTGTDAQHQHQHQH